MKNKEVRKMNENKKPAISISCKGRKRIRIHRITLHLLEDPDYIQFLVNPVAKMIAVRKGDPDDHLAIRVYPLDSQIDCFEMRSSGLVRSLNMICSDWKEGYSYRILGEYDSKNKVALFNLKDAKRDREDA